MGILLFDLHSYIWRWNYLLLLIASSFFRLHMYSYSSVSIWLTHLLALIAHQGWLYSTKHSRFNLHIILLTILISPTLVLWVILNQNHLKASHGWGYLSANRHKLSDLFFFLLWNKLCLTVLHISEAWFSSHIVFYLCMDWTSIWYLSKITKSPNNSLNTFCCTCLFVYMQSSSDDINASSYSECYYKALGH